MTDNNDDNGQRDDLDDLEDEVMSNAEETFGGDVDDQDGLGDLFTGDGFEDELEAIDELDEADPEAVVDAGYSSPRELVAAGVHELTEIPGVGVNKAAALVEWGQDNAEEGGSPRSTPGVDAARTASQMIAGNGGTDSAETEDESGSNESSTGGDTAERAGHLAARIALLPFRLLARFLWGLTKITPGRGRIYKKMIKLGYRGIYKKMGAHVVANTLYRDGEMVPRYAEVDKETGHVESSNGEWWTSSSGLQPVYIGDVPVVFGVADHHELVDPVGARIAEAVDLGPQRYQRVGQTERGYEPVSPSAGASSSAGATAATDGGAQAADIPCTFDDVWLDVSNPVGSNDGMVVSLEKAYEMHWDKGSSEEMEQQETRGMLAVMDPRDSRKKALMYVILFAAGILLGMFGPGLASQVAGEAADSATGVSLSLGVF